MPEKECKMFSRDYSEARENGYQLKSYVIPNNKGSNGEDLRANVAYHMAGKTTRLLMVNSGIHGIEDFTVRL